MLTNIYYYNYYKPYLLNNIESSTSARTVFAPKRNKMTDKKNPDLLSNQSVILNKSLKNEVIDYANQVSGSVTGLKDSAKYLIRDAEDYNKNTYKHSAEEAKAWIAEDLTNFVDDFNEARSFMETQKHSQSLRGFSGLLSDIVAYNGDRMAMFGITADENGTLSFDQELFNSFGRDKIDRAIGENIQVFNDIYEQTSQMMTIPLTEHMNFRGLSYHYNYKMGGIVTDSFNLIESGMIVDRVV